MSIFGNFLANPPFSEWFEITDIMTWSELDWAIMISLAVIVISLVVILPIGLARRKKHSKKVQPNVSKTARSQEFAVGTSKRIYTASNGEVLIFTGGSAFHVDQQGRTEHLKAVEGDAPVLAGKVIFAAKTVKKIIVTTEGDEITKNSSIERQLVTFDFVNAEEVRLGTKVFLTDKEIAQRAEDERRRLAIAQKEQAEADRLAAIAQKKADKVLAKEQAKADKLAAKAQKKDAAKAKKQSKKTKAEDEDLE